MKVDRITIQFPNEGGQFIMEQDDFENAADPICTRLVDTDGWKRVASAIADEADQYPQPFSDMDYEMRDEYLWGVYENALLRHCKAFYYEDCTDEEMETLNRTDATDEDIMRIYERITSKPD